jgi:protein O-mannosyl-transferase
MKRPDKAPRRDHTAPLLVAGVTASLYLRTIGFGFTYDDHHHFVRNPFVQDPGNFAELLPWRYFQREVPDQGRPLLLVTELFDRVLGGSATICHLQSTLWHALTAVLVYVLGLRLGLQRASAVVAGIFFGLHPVNVEAVAAISNREESLVACFGLLALLAGRLALRGGWLALLGLAAAYAAALLSKESGLAIPGLLVVLALCSKRFRPPAPARRAWLRVGIAFAIVSMGWAAFQLRLGYPSLLPAAGGRALERASAPAPLPAVRVLTGFRAPDGPAAEPSDSPVAERRLHMHARVQDGIPLAAFRAWQLVVPWPTSPEYDISPFRSGWALLAGAGVLIALALAAVRSYAKSRRVTLAIAWFFVATAPISIPTLVLNPLADRYLYLASVGWSILLAELVLQRLPRLLGRADAGNWAALVIGVGYFGLASAGISAWRDDLSVFAKAKQYAPRSARVRHNLGSALLKAGRHEQAQQELQLAVELEPTLTAAHYNLGVLAEQRQQRAQAITHYQAALDSRPVLAERPLIDRACLRLRVLLTRQRDLAGLESLRARENARDPASRCSTAFRDARPDASTAR